MEENSVSSAQERQERRNCRKCGRFLRAKESIERGIGPVCFRRLQALAPDGAPALTPVAATQAMAVTAGVGVA